MTRWPIPFSMIFLVACAEKADDTTETDDVASEAMEEADGDYAEPEHGSDDDGEAESEETVCTAIVENIDPEAEDETTDWFYRDDVEVEFDVLHPDDVPTIALVDSAGDDVPFEINWIPDSTIALIDGELLGNETYTLTVSCANELSTTFGTSEFGAPLESEESALLDSVYELELETARFTDPPMVGAFLGTYLKDTLLAKIVDVNDEELTLKVVQARANEETGVLEQDCGLMPYDFPASDFTNAPFFATTTDLLVINWDSGSMAVPISLYDMHLEGTIGPDGTAMGGTWISGMLDTSNLGPLISLSGLGADVGEGDRSVCDMLETLGMPVDCEPCEGSDYCLYVEAHFDEAPQSEVDVDETPGDADGTCPEVPDDGTEG